MFFQKGPGVIHDIVIILSYDIRVTCSPIVLMKIYANIYVSKMFIINKYLIPPLNYSYKL